jgi:hypothetical protein
MNTCGSQLHQDSGASLLILLLPSLVLESVKKVVSIILYVLLPESDQIAA